jgi:hypothetical protein
MSDTGENYLFSDAHIRQSASAKPVIILSQFDIETEVIKIVQKFFQELEFDSIYANFGNINLSTDHPFALLLFAENVGEDVKPATLFPSVTVCDSADSEDREELGGTYAEFVFDYDDLKEIENKVSTDLISISESSLARLKQHFQTNSSAVAYKRKINIRTTVDFNVWTQNKLVTNFIYDSLKQCIRLYNNEFKQAGMDIHAGGMTGRKSGDYNVDFGILLYGANISVPVDYYISSLYIDVNLGEINDIVVDPTYHHTGEDV